MDKEKGNPRAQAPDEVLLVRRKRAKNLHCKALMTLPEIAEELGVSVTTVRRDIEWMTAHEHIDNPRFVQQARQIEEERLDMNLKKIMLALEEVDSPRDLANLATVALKISERRAKLLGLDAPIRQEIETTTVNEVTPAMARAAMLKNFPNAVGPGASAPGSDPPPDGSN